MGKGILLAGIVLGVLGILWSFVNFILAVFIAILGGTGSFATITAIGFLAAIVAILGAIVGNKRTKAGASVLLGAGAVMVAAAIAIAFSEPAITISNALTISLVMGWWAYGLVIAGIVGIARGERPQHPSAR